MGRRSRPWTVPWCHCRSVLDDIAGALVEGPVATRPGSAAEAAYGECGQSNMTAKRWHVTGFTCLVHVSEPQRRGRVQCAMRRPCSRLSELQVRRRDQPSLSPSRGGTAPACSPLTSLRAVREWRNT